MLKIFEEEIKNRNIKKIKYLIPYLRDKQYIFDVSCKTGCLEIAEYLLKMYGRENREIEKSPQQNLELIFSWSIGYVDVDHSSFLSACSCGQTDVARWLWKISKGGVSIHECHDIIFYSTCSNGHIETAKFIWEISQQKIEDIIRYKTFWEVCSRGYFDIIKWLWENIFRKEIKEQDGKKFFEESFCGACESNNIDIIEWIWKEISKKGIEEIERKKFFERAFYAACTRDNLVVTKWLWNVSGKKINIHADEEFPFRYACVCGNFNMAKYLWKISCGEIDIHVKDDYIFKISPEEIIKWLNTLKQ